MESRLTGRWLSPKNALFNGKIPFLWLANTGVKPPFSKISRFKNYWSHAGQVKWKVNRGKFSLEFNSVRIAAQKESRLWNMAKSTWKSKFQLLPYRGSFQQETNGGLCLNIKRFGWSMIFTIITDIRKSRQNPMNFRLIWLLTISDKNCTAEKWK